MGQANVVVDIYRIRERGKMVAPEEAHVHTQRATIQPEHRTIYNASMNINGERIQLPVTSMGDGDLRIVVNIANPRRPSVSPMHRFVDQEIGE